MGKLEQAEQKANARSALGRIYDGVKQAVSEGVDAAEQAVSKGTDAAGQATNAAWGALGDPKVRDGLVKAVKDGSQGAREAVAKTVDTFANDPRMHEGLKTFGEYGLKVAALTALGLTPVDVYAGAGAAITAWARAHPEKVEAAMDFVGNMIPGDVPRQRWWGIAGSAVSTAWDKSHE